MKAVVARRLSHNQKQYRCYLREIVRATGSVFSGGSHVEQTKNRGRLRSVCGDDVNRVFQEQDRREKSSNGRARSRQQGIEGQWSHVRFAAHGGQGQRTRNDDYWKSW